MNTVVVAASLRRHANSLALAESFCRGVASAGGQARILRLKDFEIRPCTGCEHCYAQPGCSQDDQIAEVMEPLVAADAVVFATPVYFCTIPGMLKVLMDRSTPWYYQLDDHAFSYLLTAAHDADYMFANARADLRVYTGDLRGARWVEGICAGGLVHAGEASESTWLKRAEDFGASFKKLVEEETPDTPMSERDPELLKMLQKAAQPNS